MVRRWSCVVASSCVCRQSRCRRHSTAAAKHLRPQSHTSLSVDNTHAHSYQRDHYCHSVNITLSLSASVDSRSRYNEEIGLPRFGVLNRTNRVCKYLIIGGCPTASSIMLTRYRLAARFSRHHERRITRLSIVTSLVGCWLVGHVREL